MARKSRNAKKPRAARIAKRCVVGVNAGIVNLMLEFDEVQLQPTFTGLAGYRCRVE